MNRLECFITEDLMYGGVMAACGHHFSKIGIQKLLKQDPKRDAALAAEIYKKIVTEKKEVFCPLCKGKITLIFDVQFREMCQKTANIAREKLLPPAEKKEVDKTLTSAHNVDPNNLEQLMRRKSEIQSEIFKTQKELLRCSELSASYGSVSEYSEAWNETRIEFLDLLAKKKTLLPQMEELVACIEAQAGITYFVLDRMEWSSDNFEIDEIEAWYIKDSFLHITITCRRCKPPYMYLFDLTKNPLEKFHDVGKSCLQAQLLFTPSDDSEKPIQQKFAINIEDIYTICKDLGNQMHLQILQGINVKANIDIET